MNPLLSIGAFLIILTAIWHEAVSIPVEIINRGETICEESSGLKEIGAATLFGVTLPYTIVCENDLVIKLNEEKT